LLITIVGIDGLAEDELESLFDIARPNEVGGVPQISGLIEQGGKVVEDRPELGSVDSHYD